MRSNLHHKVKSQGGLMKLLLYADSRLISETDVGVLSL